MSQPTILFLCTGNSCRSQMAEGWARALLGNRIHPISAGIETHGLNPHAVEAMRRAGVDISRQTSNSLTAVNLEDVDLVVTVCGHADAHCPTLPGRTRVMHVPFDDPPQLARESVTEEEALGHYIRVRDEIREFVLTLAQQWNG